MSQTRCCNVGPIRRRAMDGRGVLSPFLSALFFQNFYFVSFAVFFNFFPLFFIFRVAAEGVSGRVIDSRRSYSVSREEDKF